MHKFKKGSKSIILTLLILLATISFSYASSFCDGFKSGYITGYKQTKGTGFDPFTPFCPYQPFKRFSDPSSDFEQGYLIGLRKGMADGM